LCRGGTGPMPRHDNRPEDRRADPLRGCWCEFPPSEYNRPRAWPGERSRCESGGQAMGRQHRAPYLVGTGASPQRLLPATGTFDEEWLQKFVYENPLCIPIDEIEPAFGELLPTCLVLPTPAGSIDVAFMNPSGLLPLVVCNL